MTQDDKTFIIRALAMHAALTNPRMGENHTPQPTMELADAYLSWIERFTRTGAWDSAVASSSDARPEANERRP